MITQCLKLMTLGAIARFFLCEKLLFISQNVIARKMLRE